MGVTPDSIRKLLDELDANRRSRKSAWATLQRLRKLLEANGARIKIPDDRSFETEGEAIESGLKRTIEGRDIVMRSLIHAVYRFRDATLLDEKKGDFGSALQNLYRELERAEELVQPHLINFQISAVPLTPFRAAVLAVQKPSFLRLKTVHPEEVCP
jgi:hypothetical protein